MERASRKRVEAISIKDVDEYVRDRGFSSKYGKEVKAILASFIGCLKKGRDVRTDDDVRKFMGSRSSRAHRHLKVIEAFRAWKYGKPGAVGRPDGARKIDDVLMNLVAASKVVEDLFNELFDIMFSK